MLNSKRFHTSALAIAVATACAGAHAADETDMWYVVPQAGYTILDSARSVDDDFHYGIGFGYHASRFFSVEFNSLFGDFEGDAGRTLHQTAYSLDGLFVFNRESNISPYISLGGGYLQNNFSGSDDWSGPMAMSWTIAAMVRPWRPRSRGAIPTMSTATSASSHTPSRCSRRAIRSSRTCHSCAFPTW